MLKDERLEIGDWENSDWVSDDNLQSPIPHLQSPHLVSYSQPSPGVSAMDFLQQAEGQERFFWEDVRDHITFAGFGAAANLTAWGENRFERIQEQARTLFDSAVLLNHTNPLAAPRLFGGFAFRDDFVPDNTWAVFHPAHFILPHYQLVQVGTDSWLTINALLPPDEDPASLLPQLREALEARYEVLCWASRSGKTQIVLPVQLVSMSYPMPYAAWEEKIDGARQRIAATELKKVVLSRVCELRFAEQVNVTRALAYLNEHYADCYRFLFEPRPFHAFYGATPELLAKVDGRTIATMSLAGSIGRGQTPREDDVLGNQLLHSVKDRHEHDIVVVSILERLAPFASKLEISPQPGIAKLSYIQHLYTPIRGQLHEPAGILPIVEALHPTPALGGSPRQLAMELIHEVEPVPRGWYAGPVGWIDYKLDGAFAVGIRSAVSQDRRVWLYAGAGIVADSEPQKEWEETALKFRPMLEALRLEDN